MSSAAMNLGSLVTPATRDTEVLELFHMDEGEVPVYTVTIGAK